jgi:hypothetical protein
VLWASSPISYWSTSKIGDFANGRLAFSCQSGASKASGSGTRVLSVVAGPGMADRNLKCDPGARFTEDSGIDGSEEGLG